MARKIIKTSTNMRIEGLLTTVAIHSCFEKAEIVILNDCYLMTKETDDKKRKRKEERKRNVFEGEHVIVIGWPSGHPLKNFQNGLQDPEMIKGDYPVEVIKRLGLKNSIRKHNVMQVLRGKFRQGLNQRAREILKTYPHMPHKAKDMMIRAFRNVLK